MTNEQVWLAIAGAVALVALLVAVSAARRVSRADAQVRALSERLELLESPVTSAVVPAVSPPEPATRVTTRTAAGDPPTAAVAQRLEGRLFADVVARETVIKAASWTHGLRRALAPESRNRIRFHIHQETRRASRTRKAEVKVAVREHRARSRAADADLGAPLREDVA